MSGNPFSDIYGALAYQPALLLLITGLFAGSWFFYKIIGKPEEEEERPKWLKVLDILGMIIGILIIVPSGVTMFFVAPLDNLIIRNFTKILVIVFGMGLFLKPLKDIPWGSLIGAIGGIVVLIFLAITIDTTPLGVITGIPQVAQFMPWIFLIIFGIVFFFIFMITRVAGDIMGLIGKIFASRPGSLIMMALALIQALLIFIPVDINGTLTAGYLSIIPW